MIRSKIISLLRSDYVTPDPITGFTYLYLPGIMGYLKSYSRIETSLTWKK